MKELNIPRRGLFGSTFKGLFVSIFKGLFGSIFKGLFGSTFLKVEKVEKVDLCANKCRQSK
jgi:hypothetical protein